jgi:hypothetical protein
LVILGCATPALVTPPPSVSGPRSLGTLIVQTALAAQTQTAVVASSTATPTSIPSPTRTATVSPTPTATVRFLFATNTALPTGLFAGDEGDGTSTGNGNDDGTDGFVKPTATPSEWACRVLSKSPPRDAVVLAGSSIKAVWTVQNTGTKTWPKKGVDVVYQSGARLNVGKPYYDIPAGTGPGSIVTISVTMEIPKRPKEYNMRWSLMVGKTQFCSVQFVFESR